MKTLKLVYYFIKCIFGFGSIDDGSICETYKATGLDFHDYTIKKGGNGYPCHFSNYVCPNCGKNFEI